MLSMSLSVDNRISKNLRKKYDKDNISDNTIGTGKIKTERTIQLGKSVAEKSGKSMDDVMGEMAKDIPLGRLGKPEEFAKTAVFLASEANTYVTGQALLVDGASVSAL